MDISHQANERLEKLLGYCCDEVTTTRFRRT
jgi:hypothetical protein